jgi:hypothetical protein
MIETRRFASAVGASLCRGVPVALLPATRGQSAVATTLSVHDMASTTDVER